MSKWQKIRIWMSKSQMQKPKVEKSVRIYGIGYLLRECLGSSDFEKSIKENIYNYILCYLIVRVLIGIQSLFVLKKTKILSLFWFWTNKMSQNICITDFWGFFWQKWIRFICLYKAFQRNMKGLSMWRCRVLEIGH